MTKNLSHLRVLNSLATVRPGGIMTDIDGTISRIASSPGAAHVEPAARDVLRKLAQSLDLVAAISGRSASDACALLGLENVVYAGNHGMEWLEYGELKQSELASKYSSKVAELLNRVGNQVDVPGVRLENKFLTASIHVRETIDPPGTQQQVENVATSIAQELGLRVTSGRMVVEIRPPVDLNKGSAVSELIQRFSLRSGAYIGDDVTDVDAFDMLVSLREAGVGDFYAIGVTGPETPEIVSERADLTVNGVDGVIEFLNLAVERLQRD